MAARKPLSLAIGLALCVLDFLTLAPHHVSHASSTERPLALTSVMDAAPPTSLQANIRALGQPHENHISIAVRDLSEGWLVSYNGKRLCPQQSVSKFWVALTLLDKVDKGEFGLDAQVTLHAQDLTLFHQPLRTLVLAHPQGYSISLRDLLVRALTESDNTANDKILQSVGGAGAVNAMIRSKQIGGVLFGASEREKQSRIAGVEWQESYALGNGFELARARVPYARRAALLNTYAEHPEDGASPEGITQALARLARGELLSAQSTATLLDIMSHTHTGRARLKAGMAAGWSLAHKTGTGQQMGGLVAGFNDMGILTAPDGHKYALAVMLADSRAPLAEKQRAIANVARAVVTHWAALHPQLHVPEEAPLVLHSLPAPEGRD
jgi:beta-lactamase class A